MAAGMDAAFAAAATAAEGTDNGAAIVDPRDGRVSASSGWPLSQRHVQAAHALATSLQFEASSA